MGRRSRRASSPTIESLNLPQEFMSSLLPDQVRQFFTPRVRGRFGITGVPQLDCFQFGFQPLSMFHDGFRTEACTLRAEGSGSEGPHSSIQWSCRIDICCRELGRGCRKFGVSLTSKPDDGGVEIGEANQFLGLTQERAAW